MLRAFTGQADTHMPQPVHSSGSIVARRWYSVDMAWYSQRLWQDMQITSSQAMQVSRLIVAVPMRGQLSSSRGMSSGQAMTQALQKVQPLLPKSRYTVPASSWSAGCSRIISGSQADRHGCAQSGQVSSSGRPVCQGGGGPSGCCRLASAARPVRVSNAPRKKALRRLSTCLLNDSAFNQRRCVRLWNVTLGTVEAGTGNVFHFSSCIVFL